MVSRKQAIYLEILFWILPYVRSVQTWPVWRRVCTNLYPELELVHNLSDNLKNTEIDRFDVYWINAQAKIYAEACKERTRPGGCSVLSAIDELVSLIPDELRQELKVDPAIFKTHK